MLKYVRLCLSNWILNIYTLCGGCQRDLNRREVLPTYIRSHQKIVWLPSLLIENKMYERLRLHSIVQPVWKLKLQLWGNELKLSQAAILLYEWKTSLNKNRKECLHAFFFFLSSLLQIESGICTSTWYWSQSM